MTAAEVFSRDLVILSDGTGHIRIGTDFPGFAGHFPGHPVMPGICFLILGRIFAERVLDRKLVLRSVRKARFFRPAVPGSELVLSGRFAENSEASVTVTIGGEKAAELKFATEVGSL